MNSNKCIDVSPVLANLLPFTLNDINSIDSGIISIFIPSYSLFDDLGYTLFDFSRFTLLERLIIGNDCFMNVNQFNINGLSELKSLKIGKNSFTLLKKGKWDDDKANNGNRSFHLLNCTKLESIEIGSFSFRDYGGGFELKNLPKLSTIKMESFNFQYSSFEIRGIVDDDIDN